MPGEDLDSSPRPASQSMHILQQHAWQKPLAEVIFCWLQASLCCKSVTTLLRPCRLQETHRAWAGWSYSVGFVHYCLQQEPFYTLVKCEAGDNLLGSVNKEQASGSCVKQFLPLCRGHMSTRKCHCASCLRTHRYYPRLPLSPFSLCLWEENKEQMVIPSILWTSEMKIIFLVESTVKETSGLLEGSAGLDL